MGKKEIPDLTLRLLRTTSKDEKKKIKDVLERAKSIKKQLK